MIQVTSGIRDRILKSIKHLDQFETGQGNIYGNDNIEILQNLIDISRYTDYYKSYGNFMFCMYVRADSGFTS